LPSVGRTVTVRVANYVTGTPDQERDVLGVFDGARRNEDPGHVLQASLVVAPVLQMPKAVRRKLEPPPPSPFVSDAEPSAPAQAKCRRQPSRSATGRARCYQTWRSRQGPQRRSHPSRVRRTRTRGTEAEPEPHRGALRARLCRRGPSARPPRSRLLRDRVDDAVLVPGAGLGPGRGRPQQSRNSSRCALLRAQRIDRVTCQIGDPVVVMDRFLSARDWVPSRPRMSTRRFTSFRGGRRRRCGLYFGTWLLGRNGNAGAKAERDAKLSVRRSRDVGS
jgi:hypothetical protein